MIINTGGQQAWRDGYLRIPVTVGPWMQYDDWYHESYRDGMAHFFDMNAAEAYRAAQIEKTKEIRAKFKAIRAGK